MSAAKTGRAEIRSDAMAMGKQVTIIVTRRYLRVTRNSTIMSCFTRISCRRRGGAVHLSRWRCGIIITDWSEYE